MKFEASDKIYLDERRQLSEKYGPRELWPVIDHWPLYAGIANIGRFMAIADAFRSTLDVPGNVAEFGSWRGANIMFLAKLLRVYDPNGCKTVHCFESFEGLESFTDEDGSAKSSRGTYQGSYEELTDLINLYRLQDDIVIHKGLIQETLPQVLSKKSPLTFSFIYCDTDLYEPTKVILELMHSRLAKGGLFAFDQWNNESWPGEGLAVNEFFEQFGESYDMQSVRNARQPTLIMKKIR